MADPDFSNVVTLLHLEGTNGSQVFTDSSNSANTWTPGTAGDQLSDAQFRFGASSYVVATGINVGNVADFDFGLGDFTWECFLRPTSINNFQYLFSSSSGSGAVGCNVEYGLSRPNWHCSINGITLFTNGGSNPTTNEWHHIAVARASGVFRLFMDGVLQGTDNGAQAAQSFSNANEFAVGDLAVDSLPVAGNIDEVRITKGVALYTANFTPPTEAFPDSTVDPGNDVGQSAHGQVRFEYSSPTECKLVPYDGNGIIVDGGHRQITSNIAVGTAGLSPDSFYYAYLYDSNGTLTLEFSSTGHAKAANGVETKIGDDTRTLVGMARTNGLTEFADSFTQRFVASWFNRRSRKLSLNLGNIFVNALPWVAIGPGSIAFLTWEDDIWASLFGHFNAGTSPASSYHRLRADGSVFAGSTYPRMTVATASWAGTVNYSETFSFGEGYHFLQAVYGVDGGQNLSSLVEIACIVNI